jgi:3-dehydroquinate synthase
MGDIPVDRIDVQSYRGSYTAWFGSAFKGLKEGLAPGEHLVIDERVAQFYKNDLSAALNGPSVLRIEATEFNKSLEKFPGYVLHLMERDVKRDHMLVAVGGGIIQDITAFLSAIMLRGIRWKFYPTTLLSQADSCIGAKSSINVGPYKNQVGTFTPPNEVFISSEVLKTLPELDMRSGIGEIIKAHIISGWEATRAIARDYPKLMQDKGILERAIRLSLEVKRERIEADEFDQNERLVLNYGHSFGHAIESATDYKVPHGIAVTLGMDMANFISYRLGFIKIAVYEELHQLLAINYDGFEKIPIPEERFFLALHKDKKNFTGEISILLLHDPGQVFRKEYSKDGPLQELCREYLAVFAGTRRLELCLNP